MITTHTGPSAHQVNTARTAITAMRAPLGTDGCRVLPAGLLGDPDARLAAIEALAERAAHLDETGHDQAVLTVLDALACHLPPPYRQRAWAVYRSALVDLGTAARTGRTAPILAAACRVTTARALLVGDRH